MALTQVKATALADSAITTAKLADDAVTGAKIADDTVAEANMANDAISLTELKAGTDGQIITYDASGNPTAVGPGTDGQVLTSTGAGSPPAFEDAAASVGGASGVDFNDGVKARFGTGNDLEIYHDAGGYNQIVAVNDHPIQIKTSSENMIKAIPNGGIEAYHNNSKKLETLSTGAKVSGLLEVLTATDGGDVVFKAQNSDDGNYGGLMVKGGVVDRECRFQSTSGNSFFTFYTEDGGGNVTEKLRILPDGTMRFAMEDFSAAPSSSNWGMYFGNTNNGCVWMATGETTATHVIYANGNGTCGSITTSGTSTAYNTSSDYRLKENIVGITDGITRLKQLAPKRFNFKTDVETTLDGFLAHEVTPIVPEAINGAKDAVEPEDNADKGVKKGDIIPQGIDQTKLIPLLTAALQEAIAKIEVLETKVAALQAG